MSILDWLNKKQQKLERSERLDIPGDLWVKCFKCSEVLYLKDLEENHKVCTKCDYHFRVTPEERLSIICDPKSFKETDQSVGPVDFLGFEDTEQYVSRIKKAQKRTNRQDAIVIGQAKIKKHPVNVAIMDFSFMGGSMGSVVGEKITRTIEAGIKNKYPVIIFTSSGGARMQEGVMSLMQMAKTSAALDRLAAEKVPFISVICDPTTGGTSASFAMLGDLNIAEPDALISFAGPRVIEQTIKEKLPKGFQRSEFLLEHGMLDKVVHRHEMRDMLHQFITLLDPHFMP